MLRTTGRQNYSCAIINRDSGLPRCENRLSAYYAVRAQMGYAENCIHRQLTLRVKDRCRHHDTSCTIALA